MHIAHECGTERDSAEGGFGCTASLANAWVGGEQHGVSGRRDVFGPKEIQEF